ncbi:HAD-IIIC family phosphatase [Burkholderiaceae bacterium DAT-1]|nr:HAD-IIIC family phosphatase [Burkholderiaceae bacterium DAT-1]
MTLRLTCTSFLPERHPAWRALSASTELDFGQYGDWPVALTASGTQDALAWVLFLDDLLPWHIHTQGNPDAVQIAIEAIDQALAALNQYLLQHTTPTLVAWLGWHTDSLLRMARHPTVSVKVAAYLHDALYAKAAEHRHLYLLPLDMAFAEVGLRHCLDNRNFHSSHCRLSQTGLKVLSQNLANLLGRTRQPARKVLVLDCDNTLWGGVIGEAGLSGIALGQDGLGNAFVAFQQVAKRLADSGTVLAISSKNEEVDVWRVFTEHAGMVLKRNDIATARIDWREKSIHLREIAADLDIGLDSLVFWDDNPVEREKVRAALPMVLVPEPPAEVVDWADALASLDALAQFAKSSDDLKKTEQYRARAAFVSEARHAASAEAFLASINMRPAAQIISDSTLGRAAQLCAKTNQFNLRLIRYDEAGLQTRLAEPRTIGLLASLSDRFGDHGITGMALITETRVPDIAFLDAFLMSCRVLGRHLEAWMLSQLREHAQALGYRYLLAQFIPGERNTPAMQFLPEHGFTAVTALTPGHYLSDQITAAFTQTDIGTYYFVELARWQIPHLEVFQHESPAIA